jgi:hypothetical protein
MGSAQRATGDRTAWSVPAAPLATLPWVAVVVVTVAVVVGYGELSAEAFAVVLAAGTVLAAVALARRSGSAAAPAGRGAVRWLWWFAVAGLWELYTFVDKERFPTLSDLTDHAVAHPAARGGATVVWFAAGFWLLTRPTTGRDTA